MRFIFVDRVLPTSMDTAIEVWKNVTATEDVFADHFPGAPVLPAALIVEVFEQASQLLIARRSDFAQVGRLEHVAHGTFRHFVRPGDRLRARCESPGDADGSLTVEATAWVDDRKVATATLVFALESSDTSDDHRGQAARLRALDGELRGEAFTAAPLTTPP